jgi:hypothetical protein
MPRTWEVQGTSEQVIKQWQAHSLNMGPGDVVKVSVEGGILELDEPLVVPGVMVVPGSFEPAVTPAGDDQAAAAAKPAAEGSEAADGAAADAQVPGKTPSAPAAGGVPKGGSPAAGGGRRLHQADKTAAAGGAGKAPTGAGMRAPARKVLQVVCNGDSSAFMVT